MLELPIEDHLAKLEISIKAACAAAYPLGVLKQPLLDIVVVLRELSRQTTGEK